MYQKLRVKGADIFEQIIYINKYLQTKGNQNHSKNATNQYQANLILYYIKKSQ